MTCRLTWHLLPAPTDPTAGAAATAECWPVPVAVRLSWTARDPHAVTLSFRVGRDVPPVVWTVARELLTDGLLAPAGLGDITVLPDPTNPARGELVLSSPHGRACFRFAVAPVAGFLDRLPDPPGTSPAVASLLRAAARHNGSVGGFGEVA